MDIVLRFGGAEGRGWRVGMDVVVNVDILKSVWGIGISFCFMVVGIGYDNFVG